MDARERAAVAAARRQDGVLTTAQAAELGLARTIVARRVAEGRWQRLHRGVVVVHAGPLTWRTVARAAVLRAGPGAVLSHASAGWLHGLVPRPAVVEVTVPHDRRVDEAAGVVVHRRRLVPRAVGSPPRTDPATTVADLLAVVRGTDAAVSLVAEAVRRGVPPTAIRRLLASRPGQPRRRLALELVAEAAEGVESALELRYRRDVERAHGLPRSRLQARDRLPGGLIRADCRYDEWATRVELDGAFVHVGARADADVWRDNAVTMAVGDLTLRYRWRHVLDPCRTAGQVASALHLRGWTGSPRPCGPRCALATSLPPVA